ncbi:flagellar hook-length control protein FliK [Giesbergeria giesbergeri]
MEKMHVSSASHAAPTATAKNRAADTQGQAGAAGDFLGLLSALGDTTFQGGATGTDLLPTTDSNLSLVTATPATDSPSTAIMSLLALQAGFAGSNGSPMAPSANNAGMVDTHTAVGGVDASRTALVSTATTGILQVPDQMLATGSRGMTLASGGGELGLVAQTAAFDGAVESQATQGIGGATGGGKKIAGRSLVGTASSSELSAARTASNLRSEPLDRSMSNAVAAASVQTAAILTETQRQFHEGMSSVQTMSRDAGLPVSVAPSGASLEGVLAQSGQSAARGGEGRSAFAQNPGTGSLSALAGPGVEPTTLGENPVFDLAAALPAEDAVAEQVSYWVNQNIQNAELTVEHAGHPVEVTVALSGNEAHVSFRSDQGETRALLDASVAQLRELLEGQGLVLSGMTVGDSATQGSGNQNSEQRNGANPETRQTTVQASVATEGNRHAGVVTDKAVDIFV